MRRKVGSSVKRPLNEILLEDDPCVSRAQQIRNILLIVVASTSKESYVQAGIVEAVFHDGSYIDFTLPEATK